ncbi:MAG: hypothetical protein E6Q43_06620 [Dokdonella sp.]|nr:MAG: hypothetical protein E6Q43_06620 [Dokdonella sp.]
MPFTPFHFGPGAALHAIAPRQVSFLAFCTSNVLIDLESLYNLVNHRHPVHAFLHTYVGATLMVLATVVLFGALRAVAPLLRLPNPFCWQELTRRQILLGATLGAYSHVLLDSLMHHDLEPLAPLSRTNLLLNVVPLDALHWACVVAGLLGLAIIGVRKVTRPHDSGNVASSSRAGVR